MIRMPLVWPSAAVAAIGLAAGTAAGLGAGWYVPCLWPFLLPLVLFVVGCVLAPFLPCLPWYARVICCNRRASRCVALTFDDGPCPETTPGLLALLGRHGARATFFVVGRKAARHPELVRTILAGGHELGNHTLSHDVLLALRSTAEVREEVTGCARTLAGLGAPTRWLRPPVGIVNPRIARVAAQEKLVLVNWSVKAGDRGNRRTIGLCRRLGSRIRGGDIVLLHDRPPTDQPKEAWLAELDALLSGLSSRGLESTTIEELVQETGKGAGSLR